MNAETVKQAFKDAEKSLRDKEIEEVKKIVEKTLEKLEGLKKERETIDKKIKVLKLDIDDLKEGRLDRMEERQTKDPDARGISVIIIEKEKIVERPVPYYQWPYRWHWVEAPVINYLGQAQWQTTSAVGDTAYWQGLSNLGQAYSGTISCSSAQFGTAGTYQLASGIVNLR